MDANVTAKFFRVIKPEAAAPNTDTLLKNLHAKDLTARSIAVDEGIVLRLERLEAEPNYLSGEFCRIQKTNIPPTAGDDGLTPTVLEGGKGLGHLAAFRYHIPTQIILLQMNRLCATSNRISLYLGLAENKPLYVLDPVLRADVFKRMRHAEVRAFSVRIAEPQNLAALDDPSVSAMKIARAAAKAFNAREIEIIVHAGIKKKKEKIRPRLLQMPVRKALAKLSKAGDDVKSLRAQIVEANETDWIDLLEEQIKLTEVLDLNSGNPEGNYQERKKFLINFFNANIEGLKELYGPHDGGN
ncbi:MAG TPA: DUF6731 family protein [Rhizomicrobium sp.]|jgi:hypothetical protein|nr:DUF6731 family protein [Rhizomicrobium sp.]